MGRVLRHNLPVKIPLEELSAEVLAGIVDEFVLREGTDYGRDYTLDQKRDQVIRSLRAGEAEIYFDPITESVDIRPAE